MSAPTATIEPTRPGAARQHRPGVATGVRAGFLLHLGLIARRPMEMIAVATTPLLTVMFTSIVRQAGREDVVAAAVVGSGLIGVWVLMLGEVAETVSADRSWGTLPMLMSAPMSMPAILTGRLLAAAAVGALTFVEAVAAGMLFLRAPLHVAHPAAFAAAAVLTLLSVVATGALLAPLFLASRISLLFEIVLAYPFYILGAVMFPVSELPGWAQGISNVIFLRWCTDLMRDSLRPGEIPDLAGGLLTLVVIATVSYALGIAMLHRITGRLRRLGSTEEV